MNKLKIFTSLIVTFIFLFLTALPVTAADLNIDCPGAADCSKTGTDPLFTSTDDGYWYPGRILIKTINLKNSSSEIREMAIKGEKTSSSILEEVMQISIIGETTTIWSGSVADFYGRDKIGMGIFDSGADLDYDFRVSMSIEANDDYQNEETIFDLILGFWGEPISTPAPTITPTQGAVLGAGVSAPVCTDVKPGLPTNFAASAGFGAGEVSLSWTTPAPPYTYFLIAYSDSSDWPPKWGNPDVGNVTSYTVSGLGSGTYWFWLRAGNGCMPGDFVGPISPGAIAGVPGAGPVAPGFLPGVLGVEEEVLGEETTTVTQPEEFEESVLGKSKIIRVMLWGGAVLGGLILIYFFFRRRKER